MCLPSENKVEYYFFKQRLFSFPLRKFLKHVFSSITVDGWMTCDFTSFLTVFGSYLDDVRVKMKGCVHWNSVYG